MEGPNDDLTFDANTLLLLQELVQRAAHRGLTFRHYPEATRAAAGPAVQSAFQVYFHGDSREGWGNTLREAVVAFERELRR